MKIMNNIDKDKLLHFFWWSVLLTTLSVVFNDVVSITATVLVAIGKEVYDKVSGKGNPEVLDAIYGIAPCVIYLITKYV